MAEHLETTSTRKDIVTIIVTILVRTPIDLQSSGSAAMGCPGCPARYQKMYRDLLAQGARRVVVPRYVLEKGTKLAEAAVVPQILQMVTRSQGVSMMRGFEFHCVIIFEVCLFWPRCHRTDGRGFASYGR